MLRRNLFCLCIALVGVLAMAGCTDSGDQSTTDEAPTTTDAAPKPDLRTTATGKAVAYMKTGYKVFTGPRHESDEMPPGLVAPDVAERLGVDLDNARYARSYKGARFYVVPARRKTCLFSEIKAIRFCWNTWTVANGYGTVTVPCGEGLEKGRVATFGIVPQRVRKVTIVEANNSRVTVPARNNVFVGETSSTPQPALQIEWVRGGNRVLHPIRDSFKVTRGC